MQDLQNIHNLGTGLKIPCLFMEKHPLQDFQDSLEPNKLEDIRHKFFTTGLGKEANFIDPENEVIEGHIYDAFGEDDTPLVEFRQTFEQSLEQTLSKKLKSIYPIIDTEMLSLDDSRKQEVFLVTLFKKCNYLIKKAQTTEHLKKYLIIPKLLNDFKEELSLQYEVTDKTESSQQRKIPKLVWKGQLKVLLTLFYDLVEGQDGKDPLIEAKKADVKQFLTENFLWDGDVIRSETLKTTFTPGKYDSRASRGDRIELGNVKIIK